MLVSSSIPSQPGGGWIQVSSVLYLSTTPACEGVESKLIRGETNVCAAAALQPLPAGNALPQAERERGGAWRVTRGSLLLSQPSIHMSTCLRWGCGKEMLSQSGEKYGREAHGEGKAIGIRVSVEWDGELPEPPLPLLLSPPRSSR